MSGNAGAAAAALPGRPGNLTSDQETKLQELWRTVFIDFGVSLSANGVGPEDDAEEEDDEDEKPGVGGKAADKEKKKRKRNFFGRKKKAEKEAKSEKRPAEHAQAAASDDKYGQTKEYLEAVDKYSAAELRNAFWQMVKADHPDALLLRFLRARKWDVEKAHVMGISTLIWRLNDMKVDSDIMFNGEHAALEQSRSSDPAIKKKGEDFLAQLRLGKSYCRGTDREGRPMSFVRTRLHRQGEQAESSLERFTVYNIETTRLMLVPPVDTAAVVFDMTGFSMANMDYGPVKFMIKCFEANYPESLGVVLVHKAPWLFQGIWRIIRGWLDPVVAAKVHFTNSVSELETYVARDHIPMELGGDDKWEYKYPEPTADENQRMQDTAAKERHLSERESLASEFEDATREWINSSSDSDGARSRRKALADKLRANYWQLDPYVRARSLYDRTGVIGEGGALAFYPTATPKPPAAAPVAPAAGAVEAGGSPQESKSQTTAAAEPTGTDATDIQTKESAEQADGERSQTATAGGASWAGLGVALNRSRSGTAPPSRGQSERAVSRSGPVPAGHEDDGVD